MNIPAEEFGTFRIRDDEDLARRIRSIEAIHPILRNQGKYLELSVDVYKPKRSMEQNAALFGHAYKILRAETGNDKEDLHDYFCGEYFGWKVQEVMGERRKKPIRTTTTDEEGKKAVLSKIEFADFFAFVQQRSAETVGVYIPDPDPNWMNREEYE